MRKRKKGMREYRVRYKYRNRSEAVYPVESDGNRWNNYKVVSRAMEIKGNQRPCNQGRSKKVREGCGSMDNAHGITC